MGVEAGSLHGMMLSGNSFSGNGQNRVLVIGGSVADGARLIPPQTGLEGYELQNDLAVPAGVTLTIEPGAVVMGRDNTELKVLGRLQAVGTVTQPITFTSATDSGPSQWSGLVFDGGTGELRHVTVRYGGDYTSLMSNGSNITVRNVLAGEVRIESSQVRSEENTGTGDYGLYVLNSRVVVSDTLFANNGNVTSDYTLYASGASTTITVTNSTFQNNAGYGLYAGNGATVTVTSSTVQGNGNVGIRVQDSTVTIKTSGITGNANFGIQNASLNPIVQAVNNWWGHPSGPYHPTTNPGGLGNRVSDYVVFDPWLVVPAGSRESTALVPGQPVADSVSPLGYKDYHLVTTAGQSLVVEVAPLSGSNTLWVYSRLGDLPLWTRYDLRAQEKTKRGTYELLISPTRDGIYYFSVYGRDVSNTGGNYQIVVNVVERYLSDVSPRSAGNAGEITLNLLGLPFVNDMRVELRGLDLPTLAADNVTQESSTSIRPQFDLTGATVGVYDVYAIWPGGGEEGLEAAFEVIPGIGPCLEVQLLVPGSVRRGRQYGLSVEYSNVGDADMPAPLLRISAEGAELRLPEQDDFIGSSIQLFGTNAGIPAAILPPGAGGRISLIFRTTIASGVVDFTVWRLVVAETSSLAAARLKTVPLDASDAFEGTFATFGKTESDYLATPSDNLHSLPGEHTHDVSSMIPLELQQTTNVSGLQLTVSQPGRSRAVPQTDITMVTGTVAVEDQVESAVRQALAHASDILPASDYYAISAVRAEDTWLFVSVVGLKGLDADLNWNLLDHASWFGLTLLRQDKDGRWTGAVEGTTEFSLLLEDVPEKTLSTRAKHDLDPLQRRLLTSSITYCFPWEPGTKMQYGQKGVHGADFKKVVPGWRAVDFCSDGDTDPGHAPNRLLAATAGAIGWVCQPKPGEKTTTILINGDLLYAHLVTNTNLYTGRSVNQGEELGELQTGTFSETCGYATDQDGDWFHVHWAFPDTESFQVEDWTLNLSDEIWQRGSETHGTEEWIKAGEPYTPTNLSASATGENSIRLEWRDESDIEDGFKILRDGSEIDTVGANVETYDDDGLSHSLVCSTTYRYYVKAYNSFGDPETSDTIVATTSNIGIATTYDCPPDYFDKEPADDDVTDIVRPIDPNEKVGPEGAGSERAVTVSDELRYTVYFENLPAATAPAQEVVITDRLDPDLDWTSFHFDEIAFGDRVIPVADGTYQSQTRQTVTDYREGVDKEWWVDIDSEINPLTGQVEWTFRTLDPETGELPEDPLAGFLPPNDDTGRGEGHVAFSIRPNSDRPDGTVLTNQATIVFDTEASIVTNEVTNTLCVLSGDLDDNGRVDVADVVEVASHWRCRRGDDCYHERYDLDKDDDIDIVDIMLVVVDWGASCW